MSEEREIIVLGDTTTHGGEVISARGAGAVPMDIDGIPVACVGDKVTCPRCKGTHTILRGQRDGYRMELDEIEIALKGDPVSDGSKLIPKGQSRASAA
jgi:uncharacterized Zn-binding protein involved in type VI secretion